MFLMWGKRFCEPRGLSWVGPVAVGANNVHPLWECSNVGICDRGSGFCLCPTHYEGLACERTRCVNDCSLNGVCYTQRDLADEAGRVYVTPWDATKHTGCVCDYGYRGADCSLIECPSGPDVLGGFGNETGRDCSGRGDCDYGTGRCVCFNGFAGYMCQYQVSSSFIYLLFYGLRIVAFVRLQSPNNILSIIEQLNIFLHPVHTVFFVVL